jgi:hypothetical protein
MASRSSGGNGPLIFVGILGVACLALFILTIVYLSKFQAADRNLKQMQADANEIVRPDERRSDAVLQVTNKAKAANKSVVGYLNDSLREVMTRTTGAPGDGPAELANKMDAERITGLNLLGALRDRQNEINAMRAKVEQADAARNRALADLENEVNRTKALTESHNRTVQAMNSDIDKYKAEVETYRQSVTQMNGFMEQQIEKTREAMATMQSTLGEEIRRLQNENLRLKDEVSKIRTTQSDSILRPKAEESLVDGEIIAINQASNTVTLSRGAKDKVVLGMSFSVYSDATAIRVNPATGEYPRPKAKLEVISVSEATSTARVTEEVKGNPIVRGDVIANAIYDPAKVYTFVVYGNFDTNGDGVATPAEAGDIKALVSSWGARAVDDLSGNVDFLILGERPLLPPPPGLNDSPEVVQYYMRLLENAQRYDRLLDQATSTSIPVLNQNRFYTLTGRRAGAR